MEDFTKLDLTTLRNLWMEATREYLAALSVESLEQLERRRERIKALDQAIQDKKPPLQQPFTRTAFRNEKDGNTNPDG